MTARRTSAPQSEGYARIVNLLRARQAVLVRQQQESNVVFRATAGLLGRRMPVPPTLGQGAQAMGPELTVLVRRYELLLQAAERAEARDQVDAALPVPASGSQSQALVLARRS